MNVSRILLLVVFVCSSFLPPTSSAQKPKAQIPAERRHWIDVAHKLETAPLDPEAMQDARLAVAEIASSPDFHVVLCSDFYTEFNESKYEHHAQIRLLYMLGAATSQIETGQTDNQTTNLYAVHAVLKGYAAILREEPKAKDKQLDGLAKLDAEGKLAQHIDKKSCKTEK